MDWTGWTREIARLRRQSKRWRLLAERRRRSRDMWKARAIGAEHELERLRGRPEHELERLRRRRLPEAAAAQAAARLAKRRVAS